MARSRLPLLVLAVVTAAAAAWLPSPGSAASDAAGGEYCRDSLSGLLACKDFMFGGAAAASPACCAAYSTAFDADPFCLCYIANGVYGRSTGYDVNVTHALEIPVSCGLATPPIELCNMQGLVLPPYEPSSPQPPPAAKIAESPAATPAQSPTAAPSLPQAPKPSSPPPFTSPSPLPPPPPPTSHGARGAPEGIGTVAAAVAATTLLTLLS
uniref:Bifunctional inhibitor/plant lipid transfer protein/seed storage helical domain-containing protein n=1 Tax=Oryza punctata TaxID=4537 RepID=A0A0E0MGM3_ORYPU